MKQRKTLVVQLVQHAHIHYTDALTWVRNKPSGGIVKARKIRVYLCYKVSKMFRRMIRQYANYIYQREYDRPSLNVRYQYRKISNIWKTKDSIGIRLVQYVSIMQDDRVLDLKRVLKNLWKKGCYEIVTSVIIERVSLERICQMKGQCRKSSNEINPNFGE